MTVALPCKLFDLPHFHQEELPRRYAQLVAWLARQLRTTDDARDVAQESFAIALANLDSLTAAEAFWPWLRSIALSLVHRRYRRRRQLSKLGVFSSADVDLDVVPSGVASPEVHLELRATLARLACMPEETRRALLAQRLDGTRLDQIGQRLGLSVATVKRRIAAADQALRAA